MKLTSFILLLLSAVGLSIVVDLEGYTTSDWTDILFNGTVNDGTVVSYSGSGNLGILFNGISIHKPQFDDSTATFHVVLDVIAPDSTPVLTIKKGDIGETVVHIKVRYGGEVLDIGKFVNSENIQGDPTNEKEFVVNLSERKFEGISSSGLNITDFLFKTRRDRRLVLSFYYAWYGTPEGPMGNGKYLHWYAPGFVYQGTDHPLMGLYDSWDERVLEKHMEMAYKSGIDGFVISWWGQGSYEADTVYKMLRIAHKMKEKGEDFYITVYYEGYNWMSEREALSDLEFILENYSKDDRFLHFNGKPVVFIYSRAIGGLSEESWRRVLNEVRREYGDVLFVADTMSASFAKMFGAMHTYNVCGAFRTLDRILKGSRWMARDAERKDIVFVMNVMAGYDDTHIRVPGFRVDRMEGKLYEEMWKEVLMIDPDMVVITSWNEWHEGSEIEPSKEYGEKYLKLTAKWASLWKERDDLRVDLNRLKGFYRMQFVDEVSLLRASVYVRPDNHRIYIASDNLLARYALKLLGDPLYEKVSKKLEEFGGGYNDKHDIIVGKEISGKFYSMYNEYIDTIWTKKFGKIDLLYEKPDRNSPISWEGHADLTAYVSMNSVLKSDKKTAITAFEKLLKLWDGCGLRDSKNMSYYNTYKTALLLLTAKRLYRMAPEIVRKNLYVVEKAIHVISQTQDVEGGFTVGYECHEGEVTRADDMNTETTSIVTISLLEE